MQPDRDRAMLAPERAFVIQFHANSDIEKGQVTGRIEHVVSGRARHFESLEALLVFITHVLSEVQQPGSESSRED
jgi:hypothetical protein